MPDNKMIEDDFGTTTLASSSRNEICSNGMSWRNNKIDPQKLTLLSQRMMDLEKENKLLTF